MSANIYLNNPDEVLDALQVLVNCFENMQDKFTEEVKDANETEQLLERTIIMAKKKQGSLTNKLNEYKARYQGLDEKRRTLDIEMTIVRIQKELNDIDEMLNNLESYRNSIQDIVRTVTRIDKQSRDLNKDMFMYVKKAMELIQRYTETVAY